jgi:dephospho-CoA kinase
MTKLVAIVGMAGAGKSEVAKIFEQRGFKRIRFGDLTEEELRARGLEPNEKNERYVREELRKKYGMAAYAKLNLPKIESSLESANVVVDGLYSWEEYLMLKEHYKERFKVVAVYASPATRYARLAHRPLRPLSYEEAQERDKSEIENSNKGGPIALADCTIINESSLIELRRVTEQVIAALQ